MAQLKKITPFILPYLRITFGLFLFAFGWTAFIIPSGIMGGGLAGFGTLIFFMTGIPVGYITLAVNAILLLIAFKLLGAKFGINTIFGIIVSSILFIVLQKLIPVALVKDQFMGAMIGGGLGGVGLGIAISNGGNSGGTDIVALIINKYRNISPGRIYVYTDIVIIASNWFVFHSIEKIVYGYVVMAVGAYTIDLWLNGSRQSYQIMINSKLSEKIAERISNEVKRGVTCLDGYGWYSKKDIKVVMVIARKYDKIQILKIVKETDPDAFITIAKVMGVFGQNFEDIKI